MDSDGLAEMAVGRIPVSAASEVTGVYNKTVRYETPTLNTFARGGVFVFEQPVHDGDAFPANSQILANEMSTMTNKSLIDKNSGLSATLAALSNGPTGVATPRGPLIANWAGHGTTGVWSNESFFGVNYVNQVTNMNTETVYTMLTCLNGSFSMNDNDSLAEKLLKSPNAGAAAAWASTGSTFEYQQVPMAQRFYNRLNAGTIPRLGDLIRDAKGSLTFGPDVRLSWALLGDPLLKMR